MNSFLRKINVGDYAIFFMLVLITIVTSIINPVFFSFNNLMNVLRQVSILGVLSFGMTVLIISGGIDLSIGTGLSLVGVVVAKLLIDNPGISVWVPVIVGISLGIFMGFINGALVTVSNGQPFIITLGMMTLFRGVSLALTMHPLTGLGERFENIGGGKIASIPIPIIIFIIFLVVTFFILKYTKFGRYAYAIGGSEPTAFLAGIKVKSYKILFYVFNGLMVGIAGIVLTARIGSGQPMMGEGYELQAIAAVIIGGTSFSGGKGNVWGTLWGVLLLGVIANSLNLLRAGAFYQYIAIGIVIVIAVIVQQFRTNG